MGNCLSLDIHKDVESTDTKIARRQSKTQKRASMSRRRSSMDPHLRSLLESIQRIPIIQSLTDRQKLELAKSLVEKTFDVGETLMREGDDGHEFFLIAKGNCEVYVGTEKVSELNDFDYCGEQALLSQSSKRTASVKAIAQTTCYVMDRKTFKNILRTTNIHFVERTAQLALSFSEVSDGEDADNNGGWQERDPQMTDDVLDWLVESVGTNLLFADLDDSKKREICIMMKWMSINRNEPLITQGDRVAANTFYVIETGTFQVEKDGAVLDSIQRGACVGEQALVFNAPRQATVRCKHVNSARNVASAWVLTRKQYRHISTNMRRDADDEKTQFLRRIPLLAPLYNSEISLMSRALFKQEFIKGTTIFHQGEEGDQFYLIMQGSVAGYERKEDGSMKEFTLSKNEWFGELALKYNKPRTATIAANEDCTCLVVSRKDFNALFGSLGALMGRQIEEYQRPTQSTKDYRLGLLKRNLGDFTKGPWVGRGKYGAVRFVRDEQSETTYALKIIKKSWVQSRKSKITKKRIAALFNERDCMREFSSTQHVSPFVIKLRGTFKDNENVYFLMSAAQGGDFFNILKKRRYVDERTARFYIACIINGLQYLHEHNMIHRDLKPENIVLDHRGYAMITDFGFTKKLAQNGKTYTLCGTPGYMAPEVILGQGYGKGADWFSVGCVLYDMLTGAPPFPTRADQFETIRSMMSNRLHLPMYLSFWVKDLICQLLKMKPVSRLGVIKGGTQRIREHQWFKKFNWDALQQGQLLAPIRPDLASPMDPSNFDLTTLKEQRAPLQPVYRLPNELEDWDVAF